MPGLMTTLALVLPAHAWTPGESRLPGDTLEFWAVGSEEHPVADWEADIEAAFAGWNDARPCGAPTLVYRGETTEVPLGTEVDGINVISLGDPQHLLSGATPSTLVGHYDDEQTDSLGRTWKVLTEADIVLALDRVDFTTLAALEAGACSEQYVLADRLGHDLGHALGLGHTARFGGAADTDDPAGAAMWWNPTHCTGQGAHPNADDLNGLAQVNAYAIDLTITSGAGWGRGGTNLIGPEEEDVCFEVDVTVADGRPAPTTSWSLGGEDQGALGEVCGTFPTGTEPTELRVEAAGEDACVATLTGEVGGCSDLDTLDGPILELSWNAPREAQVVAAVPVQPVLCFRQALWTITAPDGTETPYAGFGGLLPFDQDGEWTIALDLVGLEGEVAESVTVTVPHDFEEEDDEGDKSGCATVQATPAAGLLALAGLLIGARRRDS